jgi:AcrR family transcriptional regulator
MDRAPGPAPRRGRPPLLSQDKLVTVAARMAPETLTMAGVAAELGVSTSALYRWVPDREALLDMVSDTMAARILPADSPTGENWREWLTEWARNVRREFRAVPGFAVRVLTGPHRAAGHDRLNQAGVRAFTAAGMTHCARSSAGTPSASPSLAGPPPSTQTFCPAPLRWTSTPCCKSCSTAASPPGRAPDLTVPQGGRTLTPESSSAD